MFIMDGNLGLPLDIDSQVVPPKWPLQPQTLMVERGVYELIAVPLTSIAVVTSRTLKVSQTIRRKLWCQY